MVLCGLAAPAGGLFVSYFFANVGGVPNGAIYPPMPLVEVERVRSVHHDSAHEIAHADWKSVSFADPMLSPTLNVPAGLI